MPTITRASGVRIQAPAGVGVDDATPPRVTRGTRGARAAARAVAQPDAVASVFQDQAMQLADSVLLTPPPARPATRGARSRSAAAAPAEVKLSVDVSPTESAAVLLEQDGYYTWQLPETPPAPATRSARRTRSAAPRRLEFRIALDTPAAPATRATRGITDVLEQVLFGQARAFIYKFAARVIVGSAMKVLEKDVRTGLVDMTPEDPLQWKIVDDLSRLSLPANRQARVLLFVHGTFSSTVGSYGALARTDAGRAALAASRRKYDVVLGFDHRTLSDDPMGNAADLLAILERLFKDQPPTVDVIGYSRGGLVFRAFAEELLPKSTWQPTIGRAVFIAVPNAGTSLSGSEHWPLLIDFYTNLAVAASRALALIPAVGAVEPILAESLKGLGALVKYVVTGVAEEDGGVPGLAAMNPRGSFITTLNQTQSDQPTVANTWYAAITSEFEPSQDPSLWPAELPQRLFQRILDANVDFIFGGSNDLVVDTASMTAIDVPVNAFVKARFEFGKGTKVYHLCYFIQQEVVTALTNWLELAP